MKERPILFSGSMVKAILDGRKTQTRRVIKPQPFYIKNSGRWQWEKNKATSASREWWEYMDTLSFCPYGKPGTKLWVRETFSVPVSNPTPSPVIAYRSDLQVYSEGGPAYETEDDMWTWKPSIFMPRWASRILLEVTEVKVERVDEISESDAVAEGIERVAEMTPASVGQYLVTRSSSDCTVESFKLLWDSINAKRGFSWNANPFVWVVSFKRIKP